MKTRFLYPLLALALVACGDKDTTGSDTGSAAVDETPTDTGDPSTGDDTGATGDDTNAQSGDDTGEPSVDDTGEPIDTAPEREPYACGWDQGNPGDLVSTGASVGDVIADFSAPDQCGEDYHIWDGYGTFTLLISVPFW